MTIINMEKFQTKVYYFRIQREGIKVTTEIQLNHGSKQ